MGYYSGGWAPYVSVAERRKKAAKAASALAKKGVAMSPVVLAGRKFTTTFWGTAWCDNLERYRDFSYRLERGRSCVRNGLVLDLRIASREITAVVSGSEIYKVKITIAEVTKTHWKQLCADCSGGIDSLVELLQGRFSQAMMARICQQETGLFPAPKEIKFTCSCPDHASMCKHVAAALYGVGARLDSNPELLFSLRAVAAAELLANLGEALQSGRPAPSVADAELAALFDLDMAEDEPAPPPRPPRPGSRTTATVPAAIVKAAAKTRPKRAEKTKSAEAPPQVKPKSPMRVTQAKQAAAKSKPKSGPAKQVTKPVSASRGKAQRQKPQSKRNPQERR